jgi:hypothetical protein
MTVTFGTAFVVSFFESDSLENHFAFPVSCHATDRSVERVGVHEFGRILRILDQILGCALERNLVTA